MAGRFARLWARLPLPEEHLVAVLVGLVLDKAIGRRLPRRARSVGVALSAAGVAVSAAAVSSHRGQDLRSPDRLVVGGIYGRTRNPMYVGWSLLHLGAGLAVRSPGVLVTWPIAAALVHRGVLAEERLLSERFGAAYRTYARTTPRYLSARSIIGAADGSLSVWDRS